MYPTFSVRFFLLVVYSNLTLHFRYHTTQLFHITFTTKKTHTISLSLYLFLLNPPFFSLFAHVLNNSLTSSSHHKIPFMSIYIIIITSHHTKKQCHALKKLSPCPFIQYLIHSHKKGFLSVCIIGYL